MAGLEGYKQVHDSLKQLTTLNTGAIGLIIAFIEKMFPNPMWKFAIGVAIVAFAISLLLALIGMIFQNIETMNKENIPTYDSKEWERTGKVLVFSYYVFFIGICFVGTFFFRNYFVA